VDQRHKHPVRWRRSYHTALHEVAHPGQGHSTAATGAQRPPGAFPALPAPSVLLHDHLLTRQPYRKFLTTAHLYTIDFSHLHNEVVASFRVYRRYAPRLWGTPRAADERSAVRKMEGRLGEPVGWNAHDHSMFCACAPEVYEPCVRAFSPSSS